jgi:hypothetical protein
MDVSWLGVFLVVVVVVVVGRSVHKTEDTYYCGMLSTTLREEGEGWCFCISLL